VGNDEGIEVVRTHGSRRGVAVHGGWIEQNERSLLPSYGSNCYFNPTSMHLI
jgi:hypothetical protein